MRQFRNSQIVRDQVLIRRDMSKQTGMMDDLRPVLPTFIRLIASAIVLVAVQSIILGFPGINQTVLNSTYTMAGLAVFDVGLVGAIVVLIFGTLLDIASGDA